MQCPEVHSISKIFLPVTGYDVMHCLYKVGMVILEKTENIYLTTKAYYAVHLKLCSRPHVIAIILIFHLYGA